MVRFGVRRAQTLGVSTFSLPTQSPHPYPETTTSFPHSSPCHFVLLLGSLFKSSFVKPQKIIELCGTRLSPNSSEEAPTLKRGIAGASLCAGSKAQCWKPQTPQHRLCWKTDSRALAAGCMTCTSGPLETEKGACNHKSIMEERLSEFQETSVSFTPAGGVTEASQRMMSTCR